MTTPERTVVFVWRRIPPPFFIGGAEVSQQLLAEEFAAAGWTTLYLASHEPPWSEESDMTSMLRHLDDTGVPYAHSGAKDEVTYTWNGVLVRALPRERLASELERSLEALSPQLVITSQEGSAEFVRLARARTKVAGWLHSVSRTSMHVLDGEPDHALVTSQFVLGRTQGPQNNVLFYPPFTVPTGRSLRRDRDLLMVNPVPAKGSELLHRLIAQMPERHFTLVEGWWDTSVEFTCYPNVTYVPRTYNMGSLYARHKLLLVPSLVEDAFPRVIVEAELLGLPTLGSRRGGIPEAVGHPGLLIDADATAEGWAARIRALTHSELDVRRQHTHHRAERLLRPCLPELAAARVIPS
ncbi:glycosyltransferase [Streptomyces sp. AJS327]|uniref:glycosyltransferase n=1 Tax=Streptomyces sp. AJS327 TaxID=2545265 RepID=UPI0015DEA06A|nr:glycosyltransferase [Streptomyces sp. AJS327]MBA0054335.1 glycosyltransferase [Streptomyces sp. AJS327]